MTSSINIGRVTVSLQLLLVDFVPSKKQKQKPRVEICIFSIADFFNNTTIEINAECCIKYKKHHFTPITGLTRALEIYNNSEGKGDN